MVIKWLNNYNETIMTECRALATATICDQLQYGSRLPGKSFEL